MAALSCPALYNTTLTPSDVSEDHPESDLHNACVHASVNNLMSLHEEDGYLIFLYECVSVGVFFFVCLGFFRVCVCGHTVSACVVIL